MAEPLELRDANGSKLVIARLSDNAIVIRVDGKRGEFYATPEQWAQVTAQKTVISTDSLKGASVMGEKQFPERLYVTRENEGEEEEWLNPHETVEETAQVGEEVRVAVYELVSISTVRTNVEISDKDGLNES